jgi:type VI secretion system FHA domain protein
MPSPSPSAPAPSTPAPSSSPFDAFDDPIAEPAPVSSAPAPEPAARTAPLAAVEATPTVAPVAGEAAALRSLLDALGLADLSLKEQDVQPALTRIGSVLRLMIEGIREILMTRTSIKGEFRINQTMIGAGGNNPLKFSISPEQAVEAMVKPTARGYLDATAATEQALRDIKAHEVAMVTGMEAALKGVLKRLDPKALEEKIQGGGGIGDFLKGKKARYWEVYEKMYTEISDQAENDFHDLFAREFARAYQEQLDRLK